MISIRDIQEPEVELYVDNENSGYQLVGIIKSTLQFYDVLVQIEKEGSSNYSILYNGVRIRIDRNGALEYFPEGLYDTYTNLLLELL